MRFYLHFFILVCLSLPISVSAQSPYPSPSPSPSDDSSESSYGKVSGKCQYCNCNNAYSVLRKNDNIQSAFTNRSNGSQAYSTDCSSLNEHISDSFMQADTYNSYRSKTKCSSEYVVPDHMCRPYGYQYAPKGSLSCICKEEVKVDGTWRSISAKEAKIQADNFRWACKRRSKDNSNPLHNALTEEACESVAQAIEYMNSNGVVSYSGFSCSEMDQTETHAYRIYNSDTGKLTVLNGGTRRTCFPNPEF